jgi:hypothetical protein
MSIRDEINRHCASGQLAQLRHSIPGIGNARTIILNQATLDATNLSRWKGNDRYRLGRLRGDLDRFIGGDRVSVMLFPRAKSATTYLKRLEPVTDEVWEIRSCDPKPGVRVLGRFSELDVFIGLAWDFHENLHGRSWESVRQRCLEEWRRLFPSCSAHSGENHNAYVSRAYAV